jgi:hypothetical protein
MRDELDVVNELTVEEMGLVAIASDFGGRERRMLKCRYDNGTIYYLVIDDNGGYQFDSIEELREFLGVGEMKCHSD